MPAIKPLLSDGRTLGGVGWLAIKDVSTISTGPPGRGWIILKNIFTGQCSTCSTPHTTTFLFSIENAFSRWPMLPAHLRRTSQHHHTRATWLKYSKLGRLSRRVQQLDHLDGFHEELIGKIDPKSQPDVDVTYQTQALDSCRTAWSTNKPCDSKGSWLWFLNLIWTKKIQKASFFGRASQLP